MPEVHAPPDLDNAVAEPASSIVAWFAVMTSLGEVSVPAPNLNESRRATIAYFRQYHREQMKKKDPSELGAEGLDRMVARLNRDVDLYSSGLFLAGGGLSLESAFLCWVTISRMSPREALVRWRLGHPIRRGDPDPLRALVRALSRRPQPDATPTLRLVASERPCRS